MWQTVILITKFKGNFQGIVLVEVLWKAVASLLNCRLVSAIMFHDVLHWFRAGRGEGTAALKAKLLQYITAMREVVLFEVFLDLRKAYTALYQERSLDLLTAYGVRPRTVRLIRTYCGILTMISEVSR